MKKILAKIKKFFKENYKAIIILIFIYALFNYKLDVSIYTPGGLVNLNNRIVSEDKIYDSSGTINMTYVSMLRGTIPTYLAAKIIPTWDIVKNDDITYDGNMEETIKIDRLFMQESISIAYAIAFEKANMPYTIKSSNNYIVYIDELANTNLKMFDNIVKYDNIEFMSFEAMQNYISSKKIGDKVNFLVERNGKTINCEATLVDIDGLPKIGISSIVINEYDSNPSIKVKTRSTESGSSGGLMTTLAIYNKITKEDITKGKIIAGTGTINEDGTVGEIGGVKYKLSGAVKNKADVFLVPEENYKEAYEYKKERNFDIELVSVKTFEEALNYLENMVI